MRRLVLIRLGHTEAILVTAFSPDGQLLASGSGDTTIRIWDTGTQTTEKTLTGITPLLTQ